MPGLERESIDGAHIGIGLDDIFNGEWRDPSFYYAMTREFIYGLDDKEPSVVHKVLAHLEQRGLLSAIITQNIDLLHQKAGSERVIEVHGSPSIHRCPRCGTTMTFAEAATIVRAGDIPRCGNCGAVLKPEITFFGEALPSAIWERCSIPSSACSRLAEFRESFQGNLDTTPLIW